MSTALLQLKALIWVQSALGIALVVGFFCAGMAQAETWALALLACGVAWMFGFPPLGSKARALPLEDLDVPRAIPRWILVLLGLGEFLNIGWWLAGEMALIIVPANLLVGAIIIVHWATCNGVNLPVNRRSWGTILLILSLGTVWNTLGAAVIGALLMGR